MGVCTREIAKNREEDVKQLKMLRGNAIDRQGASVTLLWRHGLFLVVLTGPAGDHLGFPPHGHRANRQMGQGSPHRKCPFPIIGSGSMAFDGVRSTLSMLSHPPTPLADHDHRGIRLYSMPSPNQPCFPRKHSIH